MKTTENQYANSAKEATKKGSDTSKSNMVSGLHELFEESLKDIYWAEQALTKSIPKMIKNTTAPELTQALTNHLQETKEQIIRLEKVFQLIGQKAVAKKCDAMEGLIKEGDGIVEETEVGVVRDAGIIAACQKIEHYEIATYGTLRQFAETLGLTQVAALLGKTLEEEIGADEKLTEVAVSSVNLEAV